MALNDAIITPPGVASFLHLEEPQPMPGDPNKKRYSIVIIFDKAAQARPEWAALEKGIDAALRARWPGKLPVGLKGPFRDGAEKASQYEGYHPGDVFIQPWSKSKPGVVNIDRQDMLDLDEVYAGWTCRASVRPFAYDTAGKRGCGLLLDAVQFLRPGKRLDGRKAASEAFPDDVEGEDERV